MSLIEGMRVKTRDNKEGILVGSDDDRIWCDVRIGEGKTAKVEHFLNTELTIIDANPAPALDESIIPTGDIRHKDLVQVPDGRVGFAIALQDRIRWTVAFPDGSTKIFGEAGLTKMIAVEPPKPKPCTAIVPFSAVQTQVESTFKRCEPLVKPVLYVPDELSLFILYLGAVKEIKRLRARSTAITTIKPAIETPKPPDITIIKPVSKPMTFEEAIRSGLSASQMAKAGDAQIINKFMEQNS